MKRKQFEAPSPDPVDTSRPPKRKRNFVYEAPTSEEVHTARQLRQLLTFEQDLQQSRHGLQSFKDLLDGIVNQSGETSQEKLNIVVDYLEMVKPREVEDEEPVYLVDIMEIWSMASQMGNENVMSAVAVVLSLLLKTISNHVDLIPSGMGICRTILQRRQLELLAKNLSADKGKDFIISPSLRLVREIICLDGGALAIQTFRARNHTFKQLARNMGLRFVGEGIEDVKRPSVRTNAVRVFLSILKFVHAEAKREILSQRDVVAALMRSLKDDPPYLIFEILDSLRNFVVLDQKLQDVKIKILNAQSLIRIASLYSYQHDNTADESPSVEGAAHKFLLSACTDRAAGVLRSQQGYYPEGVDAEYLPNSEIDEAGHLGLERVPWLDKYSEDVPVRNSLLSEFIQTLRPWSNMRHTELLVAIFAACPELVANYFTNKKSFNFDPKLTGTWIGYSTLLFTTIQVDIPQFFGHPKKYARIPPPTAVVLGNIIPSPLELKYIQRCLQVNQKSKLITFFAVRLLVIALLKLSKALKMYHDAFSSSGTLWRDAAQRLVDDFCQRVPPMKDISLAYRAMSEDDLLQRVAVSQLMLLYHEVIPQAALVFKFDYSLPLSAAIKRLDAPTEHDEDVALRMVEIENLFAVAKYSPGMKWFARGKDSSNSPFVTIMKLIIERDQSLSVGSFTKVLDFIAKEHGLVERGSSGSGFKPLLVALKSMETINFSIWNFLDNCVDRCAKSPIKYREMGYELVMEQLNPNASETGKAILTPPSPLMMTIAEQLRYLVSAEKDKKVLDNLASFLSEFLGNSKATGMAEPVLNSILSRFVADFGDSKSRKRLSIPDAMETSHDAQPKISPTEKIDAATDDEPSQISQEQLEETLSVPSKTSKDNSALIKWSSKSPEELVEDGYAASVVWLLASEHPSIRIEALNSLRNMAAKINADESTYEEKLQVWLILSELINSSENHVKEAPIPSAILAFVYHGLNVLKNPLHDLYPKLNHFLLRGPSWDLNKIPLIRDILQEGPSEDGAFYSELSWLFSYLLDSLNTPADVEVFRKREVFEPIMNLCSENPYMRRNLQTQGLRILYRVTTLQGGSTTLITRTGVMSWLKKQSAFGSNDGASHRAMLTRLWETCDQQRISEWAKGSTKILLDG